MPSRTQIFDWNFFIEAVNPRGRRQLVIDQMESLNKEGLDCVGCVGTCCTFVANSMMTTPLEAAELIHFWTSHRGSRQELLTLMNHSIARFGLDRPMPGCGSRQFGRRTYSCPFYKEEAMGCTISRAFKPYGCLAFNPKCTGLGEGHNCESDQHILTKREEFNQELEGVWDTKLKEVFDLDFDKAPLPIALRSILQRL